MECPCMNNMEYMVDVLELDHFVCLQQDILQNEPPNVEKLHRTVNLTVQQI